MMTDTEQAIREALASKVSGVVPASLRYAEGPPAVPLRPRHSRPRGTVLTVVAAIAITLLSVVLIIGLRGKSTHSASSAGIDAQLSGTSWLVTSVTSAAGDTVAIAKTLDVKVVFDSTTKLVASDGFNTYAASYSAALADRISVGPGRQTLMYVATTDHQVLSARAAIQSLFPDAEAATEIVDVQLSTASLLLRSSGWTLELKKL